jgi:hypothetical protein
MPIEEIQKRKPADLKKLQTVLQFKPVDSELRIFLRTIRTQYPTMPVFFETPSEIAGAIRSKFFEFAFKVEKKEAPVQIKAIANDELVKLGRTNFRNLLQINRLDRNRRS